ncbi:hypothetical protein M2335_003240 [Sphingobium sp. B12D2B]|nr:hypothetical protein [Sphingobium sp. B12D2B]
MIDRVNRFNGSLAIAEFTRDPLPTSLFNIRLRAIPITEP